MTQASEDPEKTPLDHALEQLRARAAARRAEEEKRQQLRGEWKQLRQALDDTCHFTMGNNPSNEEFVKNWVPLWTNSATLVRERLGIKSSDEIRGAEDERFLVARTMFDLALGGATAEAFEEELLKAATVAVEGEEFSMLRLFFSKLRDHAWRQYEGRFDDPATTQALAANAASEALLIPTPDPTAGSPMRNAEPTASPQSDRNREQLVDHIIALTRAVVREELAAARGVDHSPDYLWMRVGKDLFQFSRGNQAEAIKFLHEQWKAAGRQDGFGVSEATIGDRIGSQAGQFRMHTTFWKHRALNTILRSPTKGVWALYLNSYLDSMTAK